MLPGWQIAPEKRQWSHTFPVTDLILELWRYADVPAGALLKTRRYIRTSTRSRRRSALYGRRMYETMVYWETAHPIPDQPQFVLDWARQWQAAEKIVYSRTLAEPRSARTRVEREFDPDAVRRLKADAEHDISVDGPELAAQAISAGLVAEFQMIICPVVVGGGKRFFPGGVRLDLELLEERRFDSGMVILRYGVRGAAGGLALGMKSSEILPA